MRATVLDAFSYNYRVALVEDGCFDRSEASHAITLCDMHAKYADVVKTDEVLAYFDTLKDGNVRTADRRSGVIDRRHSLPPPAPSSNIASLNTPVFVL